MTPTVAQAYGHCLDLTRERARNFHFGIRLLPAERRRALSAVYAFARRIDDIGDGSLCVPEKLRLLDRAGEDLAQLGDVTDDPVLVALADAAHRFPIPLDAFGDLIAGVGMDLDAAEYHSFDDLLVYCRRVAGSIGRLSLGTFETPDRAAAEPLADDLGVALQLTNILRDVDEDRRMGRIYLPGEDLQRFHVGAGLDGPDDALCDLIRFEAVRATDWFDRGLRLLPLLDRASAACVRTMAGIYRTLLNRIAERPASVLDGRVRLSGWEKSWLAIRSLAGNSPARAIGTRA